MNLPAQSANSIISKLEYVPFYHDCESIWSNFKNIIWSIISTHVPLKQVPHCVKYRTRQYPRNIRNLISRKAAIWRKLRSVNSVELNIRYREIALECKQAILNFDIERENRILDANNLGAFYKFVNNKLGSRGGVAPLYGPSGSLLVSDQEKADLLGAYFESVFTVDDGVLPTFSHRLPSSNSRICDININPELIFKVIHRLRINSSAGPDGLPPIFFRNTERTIIYPLSIMYRSFIDLHNLPQEWKMSIITPIFKKGSPSDPSNYRPVSLTPTCCKILESLISADLIEFLNDHNLISKHQHGFLKKHSTVTNLLESVNDWTLFLSSSKSVTIAYIDFQRAFDSVSHPKLYISSKITELMATCCFGFLHF